MAEGRIFKRRKNGKELSVWHIAYYAPDREDPTRSVEIRESAKTTDRDVAQTLLNRRVRQVANAREGVAKFQGPAMNRVTVKDLLADLEADYRRRQIKGLASATVHMRRVREFFGHQKALSMTPTKVRAYITSRQREKKANATINRELELLGRAFRLAQHEREGWTYVPYVPRLQERNARETFFERHEFEKLLEHLSAPMDDMARFAYMTGWRRGEVLPLRWSQVDRSRRQVRLLDSKNGEGRTLQLDETDWQLFERLWKARSYVRRDGGTGISDLVFHRRGKPVDEDTFSRQWHSACQRAGIVGKRYFHDLRRTFARDAVEAGAPERWVMDVGGWKTMSMLHRYAIRSPKNLETVLRLRREHVSKQASNLETMPVAAGSTDTGTDT